LTRSRFAKGQLFGPRFDPLGAAADQSRKRGMSLISGRRTCDTAATGLHTVKRFEEHHGAIHPPAAVHFPPARLLLPGAKRSQDVENGQVTFQWRDSKDKNRIKAMTLDAVEFIRRFLLHILPPGFVKIRHFGFLSNRRRAAALASCRELLPQPVATSDPILSERQQAAVERRCPVCHTGKLHTRRWFSVAELLAHVDYAEPACPVDSS
jgi:hypothetical protein